MSFDPNAIGNRIFTLRTNAKLSQEKLAEKLGVSHRHLGDLERGSSNGSVKPEGAFLVEVIIKDL